MHLYDFARGTRTQLRVFQAARWRDTIPRPDKTVYEIILGVTWIVAEKMSGERLPR